MSTKSATTQVQHFNVTDDEMDDAIPVPSKSQSTQTATLAVKTTGVKPDAPLEDDVDFGQEEFLNTEDFLPTIKVERGNVARFAFVPGFKLKHAHVHYSEGIGSFRCLSTKENSNAICCQKLGKAKDRFVGLIFEYPNADKKTGKFATPDTNPEIRVAAIRLSRANYRDINEALEEGQAHDGVDLRYKHDESRSFGYRISKIASSPRWHQIKDQALAMLEPYQDGTKLSSRIGKSLNKAELGALLSTGSPNESMEKMLSDMDE